MTSSATSSDLMTGTTVKPAASVPSAAMAGPVVHQEGSPFESMPLEKGFEFIDFEPDLGVSTKAKEKINRVSGEAPSDSSLLATLKKTVQGFEGRLHIRSSVGHFMAEVVGEDPLLVLNAVSRKIRSQLRVWKSQRFLEVGTNH